MLVSRSKEDNVVRISDNGKIVFEMKFISDEFVCIIYTDDRIGISEELDKSFYSNLASFMENRYLFGNIFCKKTPDKLVWLSDQCVNMDNPDEVGLVNRLVIEKEDDKYYLSYQNPFFQRMGIKKAAHLVSFSPCGNGHWSKNMETELTMQDEFVMMFKKILDNKVKKDKRVSLNGNKRF